MKHYIIDGNNLIGKIKSLNQIQKKNKQQSREKLAFSIARYFSTKKTTVTLHFDGHLNEAINVHGIKIIYSDSNTADDKIKIEIEGSENPKNIIVVSSDNNIAEFARVCSCQVIKSEEFANQLRSLKYADEEQAKIDAINSNDEFKKIFGIKFTDKTELK